jgi:hypothetical protein
VGVVKQAIKDHQKSTRASIGRDTFRTVAKAVVLKVTAEYSARCEERTTYESLKTNVAEFLAPFQHEAVKGVSS